MKCRRAALNKKKKKKTDSNSSPPPPRDASSSRGLGGGPWPPAAVVPGSGVLAGAGEERLLSFFSTPTPTSASPCPTSPTAPTCPRGSRPSTSFLRDFRTGDEHPIDPALFDVLNDLRLATGTKSPFQVISAYRSPQTNASAAGAQPGCGTGLPDLQGRAIDVRLADVGSAFVARRRGRAAARRRRLLPRPRLRPREDRPRTTPVGLHATARTSRPARAFGNAVESAPKNPSQGKTPWASPPGSARTLRDRRSARGRRHGRGVPRPRRAPRPQRRGQGPARGHRRRRDSPAVRARGPRSRPLPPEHPLHLRHSPQEGEAGLRGHRAARGRDAARAPRAGPLPRGRPSRSRRRCRRASPRRTRRASSTAT